MRYFSAESIVDDILAHIENLDAVAIGCGMGRKDIIDEIILEVLKKLFDKPVVIDADGIRLQEY